MTTKRELTPGTFYLLHHTYQGDLVNYVGENFVHVKYLRHCDVMNSDGSPHYLITDICVRDANTDEPTLRFVTEYWRGTRQSAMSVITNRYLPLEAFSEETQRYVKRALSMAYNRCCPELIAVINNGERA